MTADAVLQHARSGYLVLRLGISGHYVSFQSEIDARYVPPQDLGDFLRRLGKP